MKLIQAIVQPSRVEPVRDALVGAGASGVTTMEVRGYGRQWGHKATYRGAEYDVEFTPKVEVQVVVADAALDAMIEAIVGAARSGEIGDGKIFVSEVERALRLRTGETDDSALT